MLMSYVAIWSRCWSALFNRSIFSERGSIPNDGMAGSQIGRFDKMGVRC